MSKTAWQLLAIIFAIVLLARGCSQNDSPKYVVAEIKEQPLIGQRLVQVVVPAGTSFDQIKKWHGAVMMENSTTYDGKPARIFVNYYDGRQVASRLVASDQGGGELVWMGSSGP